MPKITEEQLAKVKAAHAGVELHLLEADPWDEDIIVRVPPEASWSKWQANRADPETRRGAQKDLVNECLVFPSHVELAAICDRRPALLEEFAGGCCKIAGVIQSVKLKKL